MMHTLRTISKYGMKPNFSFKIRAIAGKSICVYSEHKNIKYEHCTLKEISWIVPSLVTHKNLLH